MKKGQHSFVAVFLLALCACADRSERVSFDGRWNIKARDGMRVACLEIEGSETTSITGVLIMGLPGDGGGTYRNLKYEIHNGELRFTVPRDREHIARPPEHWTARIVNNELEGKTVFEAQANPDVDWTGKRAPVISDQDGASWIEGEPISVFNGSNLSGWKGMMRDKPLGWEVRDGILSNPSPPANNLVTEKKFWNFVVRAEYRLQSRSNSGLGLRGRYEVSILSDFGRPPSKSGHGAIYSRIAPTLNGSRPPGEWQTLDVRLVGRQVTVVLNDVKVIDRQQIEGLTGLASDVDEAEPGPLTIQGDHGVVEFRKITVTPLVQQRAAERNQSH